MFDALLNNPLVLALPPIISVLFGFLLSRAVELVPAFAVWWDKQTDQHKLAYRGWAGLILSILIVVFSYFAQLLELQVASLADWLTLIAAIVISWLLYVASAEGTYRATVATLPRKQSEWTPQER